MSDYEQVTALEWARTKAKWFFSVMAAVMVGALFFGLQTGQVQCGSANKDPRITFLERQNEAIATVGGEAIQRGEFDRTFRRITENYQRQNPPGTLIDPMQEFQMKAQAISSLISSELLQQKALEHGLTPSKEKIEEQLRQAEANLVPPLATGAERSILQKIGDGLQEKKRRNQFALAVSRLTGMTMDDFKKMIELQIIQQDYEAVMRKDSEAQVKSDALKSIEELKTKAEAGDEFATLAKEHSQDAETKEAGGRLDQISAAQMHNDYGQEYLDVLRNTAPGSISKPIFSEAKNGYYLVKLDTFRRAEGPEFEAEKEAVRTKILDKKRQDAQTSDDPASVKVDATEDEIRDAYELAGLWQIFIPVGNADEAFGNQFDALLDGAHIEVKDPEANAGFLWMIREDIEAAVASEEVALQEAKTQHEADLAGITDPDEKESLELTRDLNEAAFHYVLGQLQGLIPDTIDQKRIEEFFKNNQNNLDAFSSFPEPTEEEKTAADDHRRAALSHYEASYKLDNQRPWTPIALASTIVRLDLTDRFPEALTLIKDGLEYASLDVQIHQRAQQALTGLKPKFDAVTQPELIADADTVLADIATKIADIQKKQEDFKKKQEEEMQTLLDQSKPATQAEIQPEEGTEATDAPPAMEEMPLEPAMEAPATDAPAVDTPPTETPATGDEAPPPS